jgi:hypothetical protein
MSIVTIRANQNSYGFNQTGGTRDPQFELQDRVAFVDAVERRDATILNQTKKGPASNLVKPKWGMRSVNPRATIFGAQCLAGATSITTPSGHSARLQQGHVLRCVRASDGEVEIMVVNDDPALITATVHRAQGGTVALQFEIGDEIKIIGVALPEGADFPLSPVSRGNVYYNRWQFFGGALAHTLESDTSPSVDNLNGSLMSKDILQVVKDMKLNLSETLLFGRRQNGDPSPAAPIPSLMGGILQMAELSGNIFNIGGSDVLLSPEAIAYVDNEVQNRVGSNAPDTYLMSFNTRMLFNQLMAPARYNRGTEGTNLNMNWESITTASGTINFTHIRDFPDGVILGYDNSKIRYMPREGADWKEKDFPTKGLHSWHGIGGIYSLTADNIPAMFLIRGFDTNPAHYPSWNRPSTFLT